MLVSTKHQHESAIGFKTLKISTHKAASASSSILLSMLLKKGQGLTNMS